MNSRDSDQSADSARGNCADGAESMDKTQAMSGDTAGTPPATSPDRPDEWLGRRLGKYEITSMLGVGGMGVVLKAHDTSIERDVAIKVLPAELSADKDSLHRFLGEARSAGKLNHPNIVTIHDIGQEESLNFLVMEIVSGGSVADTLESRGTYSISEATRIVSEACAGLSAAHKEGVVHRDVKPGNLLLTQQGSVKVADFGLAKRMQNHTMQVTQAGQIVGTPYYMSPEQCESKEVDARSDIYSLGATYYSLLTGKCPYEETGSVVQVMFAHCNAQPPDPRQIQPGIPTACVQIVQRAMATQPDQRYQSMEEMRVDLESVLAAMSGVGIRLPSQSGVSEMSLPNASVQIPAAQDPTGVAGSHRPPWTIVAGLAFALTVIAVVAFFASGFGSRGTETPLGNGTDSLQATADQDSHLPVVIAPPTGQPIKVGILHSITGNMADSESPVVDAALFAIDEVNRHGGLLGRPVEAIIADGRSDSMTFANEARRLITEEQVSTVFGCWTSSSRKTVVPIFEELDHLLIYPVQYEGLEESPNVIYTGAAPNQQIIPAVNWAYESQGKRRFLVVGSDYIFPRVALEIVRDQLSGLGAELVGEEFLLLGSTDVDLILQTIETTQPDVILNFINGDSNTAFFHGLQESGVKPDILPTISFSVGEEELRHLEVSATQGHYAAWNYFQSIDSPENRKFVASFRRKYGPQRVLTDPMEAAYFGVKLWAKAVQEAESTAPPEIRRAIRNQRMHAPGGDVRIDPTTQHTVKTPRIGRVGSDGQFEIVWAAAAPEPPDPYPASRTSERWRALLHDLYTGWHSQWSAP